MSRKTYSLVFPSQYEYIDGPEYVSQRVWKFPYLGFRTTGYCLFLILVLGEGSLNATTIAFSSPILLYITSIVGLVFAVASLAWISVLLAFNNRPTSHQMLSKAESHFVSFLMFSLLWFALACMWSIPTGLRCSPGELKGGDHAYAWCGLAASEAGFGWLIFSLSLAMTFIIYKQSSKLGLHWNIACLEKPRYAINAIPYKPFR